MPTARTRRLVPMLLLPTLVAGCSRGMEAIDAELAQLLAESSSRLGPLATTPPARQITPPNPPGPATDAEAVRIESENPPPGEIVFTAIPAEERSTEGVMERLEEYRTADGAAETTLDLAGALAYAGRFSRDYRFAEEEYVLAGLRLLIEQHRWGPRFFDDIVASVSSSGDEGLFDSSLAIVNELGVTQRLPYGGTVSASVLATVVEDLHERVAGEDVQDATILVSADVPLLRGAGLVAREDLIQSRRNVVYAARAFERFRREFLVDIAESFLDLVVRLRGIRNAERQVESLQEFEQRQLWLYQEGRQPQFEYALAANATIRARDSLNQQRESYRLAVDRFKLRIGMPVEQPVAIVESTVGLDVPDVSLEDAVQAAMAYRLDLQNARDRLDDDRRAVANARNDLLADLDLTASVRVPTDDDLDYPGLDFEPGNASVDAGLLLSLPLDREIERIALRQSQIDYERAVRVYERQRDSIAVDVRGAVRAIDAALFSLRIQEQGIEIAERRIESIEADPDAATPRDRTDAENDLVDARDARDRALRDLEVAILRFLLESGRLRVGEDGMLVPLSGIGP